MTGDALRVQLAEVFSSFQGEGPSLGERQVFVRLAGCDVRCAYCDTLDAARVPPTARVQIAPDEPAERYPANPVDTADLVEWVMALDTPRGLHHAVTITGGEPLLQAKALRALVREWRRLGVIVHLETGGHHPEALAHVLPLLDRVTPDLKFESATGWPTPWDAHDDTLRLLGGSGKALAVKAVVCATTSEREVGKGAELAATYLASVPFVLQPVTPIGENGPRPPSVSHLFRLHAAASRLHVDVRVIPQVHRMLGVR